MKYYDTVSALSPEQMEAFYSLRNYVRDDINLITGLSRISNYNGLSPSETMELVINMWQKSTEINIPTGTTAMLKEGNIILGRAPPIKIDQLPKISPPMMRFLGEHLSQMDVVASRQWSASVPVMLNLQGRGMFTTCPVTKVINSGRSVILLNNQLEISIYKLYALPKEDCHRVFVMIGHLSAAATSSELTSDLLQVCVSKHRLRLKCQRLESIRDTKKFIEKHVSLLDILQTDLKSYEQDRLYTFVSEVKRYMADTYMEGLMKFVHGMQPKNVSELVAYCEFAITRVEDEALLLKRQVKNKELIKPESIKLSTWTSEYIVYGVKITLEVVSMSNFKVFNSTYSIFKALKSTLNNS